MNIIKKLKGYWRRLTSPKKDLNFYTKETQYGEINITPYGYIHLKNTDIEYDKICIQISLNEFNDDAKSTKEKFIQLLGLLKIQYINHTDNNLYIIGPADDYIKLFLQYENLKNDNKILGLLYNCCKNINIIREKMTWLENTLYYSYEIPITTLSKDNPIIIYDPMNDTCIKHTYNINIIPELIYIYLYINSEWIEYNIIDFFIRYNNDNGFKEIIDEIHLDYPTKFILQNGKNIFSINFKVNSSYDTSYDDIDEIIN